MLATTAVSLSKKVHTNGCYVTPSQTFSSSSTDRRAPVSLWLNWNKYFEILYCLTLYSFDLNISNGEISRYFSHILVTITKINYYHRKVQNLNFIYYWKFLSEWEQSKWGCEWICKFYSCSYSLLNWRFCLYD